MSISTGLLAALYAASFVPQASPKNMTFSTTLKSVAVFRDGFGYYIREGKVKLEGGYDGVFGKIHIYPDANSRPNSQKILF